MHNYNKVVHSETEGTVGCRYYKFIILKIGHTKVKNIQFFNSEEIRRRDSEEMTKTCKEKRMPHFFSQMLRGQSHKQVNLIFSIKLLIHFKTGVKNL